ncbi:MAG: hypothetical protein ACLVJH_17970 [Faecalibacterium prausnitzii]
MQVGTGKSVLNGIAIGKLKICIRKRIPPSLPPRWPDTAAEEARFEDAPQQKAIEQQTAAVREGSGRGRRGHRRGVQHPRHDAG